jgi:5'-3' exonuclease
MKSPLLMLIDGTNLTHAIYHATKGATPEQQLGMLRSRIEALSKLNPKPTHVAVAMDTAGPNWRAKLYPEYKAGRGERDPELRELLERSLAEVPRYCDELLTAPGVEADDLIATRWQHAMDVGGRCVVVSADRDLWQLLRPAACSQLMRFKTNRGNVVSPTWKTYSDFVEDYGFEPHRWPLYKAIAGDKSDNIAGVFGLGDTAARAICKLSYETAADALADRWKLPLSSRQLVAFDSAVKTGTLERDRKLCTLVFDVDVENGAEPGLTPCG